MVKSPGKSRSFLKILGIIIALITGLFLIVSYYYTFGFEIPFYKSPKLKAMEKAASIIQISSGRLSNRMQNDFHYSLGMAVYPKLILTYKPLSNYTPQDVFRDITQIYQKANWQKVDYSIQKDDTRQTFLAPIFSNVQTTVIIVPEENTVRVYYDTDFPLIPPAPSPQNAN